MGSLPPKAASEWDIIKRLPATDTTSTRITSCPTPNPHNYIHHSIQICPIDTKISTQKHAGSIPIACDLVQHRATLGKVDYREGEERKLQSPEDVPLYL